jgi:hypothetical protein
VSTDERDFDTSPPTDFPFLEAATISGMWFWFGQITKSPHELLLKKQTHPRKNNP